MSHFLLCVSINDEINMISETSFISEVVIYILHQILSKKQMLPKASYICLRYQMILSWNGKLLLPYTRRIIQSRLPNHLGKDRHKHNRLQSPPKISFYLGQLLSTLENSPEGSLDKSGWFLFHFSVFQYVLHFYLICMVFDFFEVCLFIYLFIIAQHL